MVTDEEYFGTRVANSMRNKRRLEYVNRVFAGKVEAAKAADDDLSARYLEVLGILKDTSASSELTYAVLKEYGQDKLRILDNIVSMRGVHEECLKDNIRRMNGLRTRILGGNEGAITGNTKL